MHFLHLVGALAAAITAALALATRSTTLQQLDDRLESAMILRRRTLHGIARIGTLPGERVVHPLMGALSAAAVLLLRPDIPWSRAVLPLAGASLGAIIAHHAVKLVYRRPRPAGALARGKTEPAFPSGHTADATAVLLTSAWMLTREGILPAWLAVSVALSLALLTGASRVALGWHWGSDVVGGWLTGVAVAAECALLYEWLRLG